MDKSEVMANREKWIEALEGRAPRKYAQASGYLTTGFRSFCCLGVACEVVGPAYGVKRISGGSAYDAGMLGSLHTELNKPMLRVLGLSEGMQSLLMRMNDGGTLYDQPAFKFPVIAAVIRKLPIAEYDDDDCTSSEFNALAFLNAHPSLSGISALIGPV